MPYSFVSQQTHFTQKNGKRQTTTESVLIRNGKGTKKVVKQIGKKKTRSQHKLSKKEIKNIMNRKFMPDLFLPCHKDCAK